MYDVKIKLTFKSNINKIFYNFNLLRNNLIKIDF